MTSRFFDSYKHANLYLKYRPRAPTDVINRIIQFVREKISAPLNYALDIGCGSGQSTSVLAPYFEHVMGADVSNAQITEAVQQNTCKNVEYRLYSFEEIPLNNHTVQLITANQSAHWFDLPKFYKEVDRLLVPCGVLALYGYNVPMPFLEEKSITEKVQKLVSEFYSEDMGKYWPPQRAYIDNCYKNISLPYDDNIRTSITSEIQMSLADYFGYFTSWSSYQRLKEEDSEKADYLLNRFQERLMEILPASSPENFILTLHLDYFLLMGRKGNS